MVAIGFVNTFQMLNLIVMLGFLLVLKEIFLEPSSGQEITKINLLSV